MDMENTWRSIEALYPDGSETVRSPTDAFYNNKSLPFNIFIYFHVMCEDKLCILTTRGMNTRLHNAILSLPNLPMVDSIWNRSISEPAYGNRMPLSNISSPNIPSNGNSSKNIFDKIAEKPPRIYHTVKKPICNAQPYYSSFIPPDAVSLLIFDVCHSIDYSTTVYTTHYHSTTCTCCHSSIVHHRYLTSPLIRTLHA